MTDLIDPQLLAAAQADKTHGGALASHHDPVPIDDDPQETAEWLSALEGVIEQGGAQRARYLFSRLAAHASAIGVEADAARMLGNTPMQTPYVNTITPDEQTPYPGDRRLEDKLSAAMRWNALAMVVRANRANGELGGHIASYASAADLFEVGFHHFFRAGSAHGDLSIDSTGDTASTNNQADLVYFQPHSAPGVYARAFLEGFLDETQLEHYRREIVGPGLCSYPHPWLMPDFWQFPTGSMGIGPINAIYQARFMRYLHNRALTNTHGRKIWGFFGDGEMDEPESVGALSLAARERLDNLIFVINCNLQRLDGPVRSNGRIIDELESHFAGAGWHVIKVVWGSDWDPLFARDHSAALQRAFAQTVDGQFQTFSANDGAYNRERFFGQSPELSKLVEGLSDDEIDRLHRGGHDARKLHAAYARALREKGRPTVILAQTMKGFGMGKVGQGRMTTHQQKKLDIDALKTFRDRFDLPLSDDDVEALRFYRPAEDSPEMRYLHARRTALGGYLPRRRAKATQALRVPAMQTWARFAMQTEEKSMSSTMALVRMLGALLKDADIGARVVPIVADEARTFGMANLFRQVGIYSPLGQLYEPEDRQSMLYYREDVSGQILEEGISEAGALSSWVAAATSYSVHDLPMMPFYIFYSMFGFQRVGDLIWAAADQRARGFLIGATSGKTTLSGEGLQHQDGTSLLAASTIPNCRAFDPAYAYELAVIVEEGMLEMGERQQDVFYYVTLTNENVVQPSMPEIDAPAREGILKGMHCVAKAQREAALHVHLLGAGAIFGEVMRARQTLLDDWGIASTVWSVTSFTELQRDGMAYEHQQRFGDEIQEHAAQASNATAYVTRMLGGTSDPVIAATDYVRALPELIRAYVPNPYLTLGTDGFGRSDGRAALRAFFDVDAAAVVLSALDALHAQGGVDDATLATAKRVYREKRKTTIRPPTMRGGEHTPPWMC